MQEALSWRPHAPLKPVADAIDYEMRWGYSYFAPMTPVSRKTLAEMYPEPRPIE